MKNLKLIVCLFLAALLPQFASALIVGPYTADAGTLHLWHLNESAAPAVDTGNSPTNLTAVAAGATLNNTSFTGFGTALSTLDQGQNAFATTNSDAVLSIAGNGTNGAIVLANATTAAFTMEALVHIEFDPTKNLGATTTNGNGRNAQCMILTAEGNANANRLFQFRIDPCGVGVGSANNIFTNQPALEFINLHLASSVQNMFVMIPTNGPDAIVSNSWYHVAVTYTGSANTVSNLLFYWTLLDATRATASLVGGAQMVNNLSTGSTVFTLGNTGRNPSGVAANPIINNFLGRIDEVRISSVARTASQMMFAPATVVITQQPIGQEGVDYGGTGILTVGATSVSAMGYQWCQNTAPIGGATNTTYTFTNASLASAGSYTCVITNLNGSAITSSVASVVIGAAHFLTNRYSFTSDASDSIGGQNGTVVGGTTFNGNGTLTLDGSSGFVQLPSNLINTNAGAVTLETWVSFGTIANNSQLFAFGNTNGTSGYNYIFATPHGSAARMAITAGNYTTEQIASAGTALDNYNNVQIVCVFAPYANTETFYTNGVLAAVNTNATLPLASVIDNFSYLGKSLYSGDPYLAGTLDEFRIYNGALSAATIQQSYLQGPDNALSAGPVAILVSPTNATVAANQPATFSGLASGQPNISYQWFKNNVLISGATNRTYTYNAPYSDNNASFVLEATNTVSATVYTATSTAATLTVLIPETLAWLGAADNGWNLSSLNWSNSAQSLVAYAQLDGVMFDERGVSQPNVDLQFAVSPIAMTVSNVSADYLISSASANGSLNVLGTLLKQGPGKLTIDVTNVSAGPTVVQNGTLQIGNNDTLGSLGSGPVTNNATLQFNRSDSVGVPNDVHGTGTVVLNSGSITPTSTNNDYTGGTTLAAGILYATTSAALGATNGGTTVANGAQLYLTGNVNFGAEALTIAGSGDGNGALRKGGAGATTYAGPVTLTADTTIGVDTGATLNLTNAAGITGTDFNLTVANAGTGFVSGPVILGIGGLTKNGTGTLTLNSSNSYSGITAVNGGVLALNNSYGFGSSTQVVVSSTTGGALGGTRLTLGAGVAIPSTVALSLPCAGTTVRSCLFAAGACAWNGSIMFNGDSTVSPGDQIAFASSGGFMTIGGNITSVNFPGTLQLRGDGTGSGSAVGVTNGYGGLITGNIALGDSATLQVHDGTTWTIASTGNNWSISELAKGTLRVGVNNALPSLTIVKFGAVGNATLDLNGYNQSVGTLTVVGNTATITNSSAASDATLTFATNGGASYYSGFIKDGLRKLNLTVAAGTLTLSNATSLNISNSTVSVSSGAVLDLEYTGTNTVAGFVTNGVSAGP